MTGTSILLLDEDARKRRALADALAAEGYRVRECASPTDVRQQAADQDALTVAVVGGWGRSDGVLIDAERDEITALTRIVPTIVIAERPWADGLPPGELGLVDLIPRRAESAEIVSLIKSTVERLLDQSVQRRAEARGIQGHVADAQVRLADADRRSREATRRSLRPLARGRPSAGLLRVLQGLLATDVVSLGDAFQRAAHDLAEVLGADKVDVFLHDPERRELVAVGTSQTPMGRRQHALGLDRLPVDRGGRAGHIFETGRNALIRRSAHDPDELPAVVSELGVRSCVGTPIDVLDERRGVLLAASGTSDFFFHEDLTFLETVAQWIGLVGHRLALAERLAREVAEAGYRAGADQVLTALTPRQREVAGLIAQGLSNIEIAQRLVLTPGTVANHVEHILRRLGLNSRIQVATLIARRTPDASESGTGQ